jgi:hypothetical protein
MAAGPASQVNDWQTVKGAAEPADWQTVGAAPPIPGMEKLGGSAPPPVAPPNPILNGPGPWLPRFGNSLGQSAKGIVMGAVPGLSETVQDARALSRGGLPEVQRVQNEGNPINQALQGVRGMGPVTMRDVPEIAGRMAAPFLPGGPQVVQGSEQLARGQTAEGLGTLALPAAMIVGPKAAEGVGAVAERGLRSPFRMGEPLLPDLPMTGPKYGAAQKISAIRLQSPIQPPTYSLPPPPAFLPGRPAGMVPVTTEAPAFLPGRPRGIVPTTTEAPAFLQTPPEGPRSEAPPFLRTPEPEPSSPPPAFLPARPPAAEPPLSPIPRGNEAPSGPVGMVRPTPAVPPGRPAIAPPMPSGRGLQMPAGMPRPIAPAVPGPEAVAAPTPPVGPTIAPPAPPSRGLTIAEQLRDAMKTPDTTANPATGVATIPVDIPGTHPEAQPAIVTGQRLARAATASGIVGDLKAAGYTLEDLPAGDDVKGWQKLFDTAQSPFRKTPEAQRKMIDAVRAEFGRQGKPQ